MQPLTLHKDIETSQRTIEFRIGRSLKKGGISSSLFLMKSSNKEIFTTSPGYPFMLGQCQLLFLNIEQKTTSRQLSLLVPILPLAETNASQPPLLSDNSSNI